MARIIPPRRVRELKGPFPRTPKPDTLTQLRTANEIAKLVGTILQHPATDMIVGGLYRLFSDTDDPGTRARGEGALRLAAAQQGMTLEEVDTAIGVTKDALAEMDAARVREAELAEGIAEFAAREPVSGYEFAKAEPAITAEQKELAEEARPREEEDLLASIKAEADTKAALEAAVQRQEEARRAPVAERKPVPEDVDILQFIERGLMEGWRDERIISSLQGMGFSDDDLRGMIEDVRGVKPEGPFVPHVSIDPEEVAEAEADVERKAGELAASKARATRREVIEAKLKELLAAKETLTAVKGKEEIGYYELLAEASVAETDAEKKAILEKLPLLQNYGPHIPGSLKDLIMGSHKTKAEGIIVDTLGLSENELDKWRRAQREAGLAEATAEGKLASAEKARKKAELIELEIGDYTERSQAKIKKDIATGEYKEAASEAKRLRTRWDKVKFDLDAPKLEVEKLKEEINALKARSAKALLAKTVAPKGLRDGISGAVRAYDTKLSAWIRRVADAEGAAAIDPMAITAGIVDLGTRNKLRTQYRAKKQAAQKLLKVLKPQVAFAEKQKRDLQALIPDLEAATVITEVDARQAAIKAVGVQFGDITRRTP